MAARRVATGGLKSGLLSRRSTKAFLVLSETGPVLILTNFPDIRDRRLMAVLQRKGFTKFIAYSLPVEQVRQVYGVPFEVISAELQRVEAVRVLDYDGSRIFDSFSIGELHHPFTHEA